MILCASAKFRSRLRGPVSRLGDAPLNPLACWSADVRRFYRAGDVALLANEATLVACIVPLKGVRSFEGFVRLFLGRAAPLLVRHGSDPANLCIATTTRRDRSVVGSVNDMWQCIEYCAHHDIEGIGSVDWEDIQRHLHRTPYSAIGFRTPEEMLNRLTNSGG